MILTPDRQGRDPSEQTIADDEAILGAAVVVFIFFLAAYFFGPSDVQDANGVAVTMAQTSESAK